MPVIVKAPELAQRVVGETPVASIVGDEPAQDKKSRPVKVIGAVTGVVVEVAVVRVPVAANGPPTPIARLRKFQDPVNSGACAINV